MPDKQIGVRVSEEVYATIKAIADSNERSLNGEIKVLINKYIKEFLETKPEIQHKINFK